MKRASRNTTPPLTIQLPAGTPHWITQELVEQTLHTWQPYYSLPLTIEDAIDMIRNAGRLFDALSGK